MRFIKFLFGALFVIVLVAGAFLAWYVFGDNAPGKPTLAVTAPSAAGPKTPNGRWRLVPLPRDYVGYRIKELFGDTAIKRDAVGRTHAVTGTLVIASGRVSTAVVDADISKLDSGRAARDSYTRESALEGTKYPHARFTLAAPITLPAGLAKGQKVHTQASGTLLLHGVTRPVTITIDARWNGPTIEMIGNAPIVLRDFAIDTPNTPIAKVDDHGSLELDLEFVPSPRA